jgi:uncharacterized RDD family membrane protein YckC
MAVEGQTSQERAQGAPRTTDPAAAWIPPEPSVTAERIGAEPASWWARVGATLLDGILIFVILCLVLLALTIGGASLGATGFRIAVLLVGLAYAILMLAYHGGQTTGKEVFHIRVVAEDGSPVGPGRAAGRELLKSFFGILFALPALLDVLWPLWQPENRALHDLMAGTRVVKAARRPPAGYYPADEA